MRGSCFARKCVGVLGLEDLEELDYCWYPDCVSWSPSAHEKDWERMTVMVRRVNGGEAGDSYWPRRRHPRTDTEVTPAELLIKKVILLIH